MRPLTKSLLTYGILIGAGVVLCWSLSGMQAVGEATADAFFGTIEIVPHLLLGFTIAGFVSVLIPRERISALLGEDSGLRGIFVATAVGAVLPGGPFASFPLVVALSEAGAGAGPLIAFLIAWAAIGVNRLFVWEIPLMGGEFAVLRFLSSLPLPIIAGLIAAAITKRFSLLKPQQ